MALPAFAAGVSMSAAAISVELGNSTTAMLDFNGAAASFSGITSTEETEGFGAAAIEMREFYGLTFSAGSGTYGTRNAHVIKYLTDAGAPQAWSSNQMIQAAENSSTNMSANTSFSARTETYHVDDYIDNDLTNADIIYVATSGTSVFNGDTAAVDSGGTGVKFYFDDTADDIMSVNSSGVVANVRSIVPSNLSLGAQSIGTDNVVVRATGNTQVTRTIRFYKDGSSVGTSVADGGGGSAFAGGGLDNTSQTEDFTFTGLDSSTQYTFKVRGENAVANGADSSNLVVTTAAPATAWSNVPADFNLHIPDGDPSANENATSAEKSITLANGSGNTTIQCQQPSAGDNATSRLQVRGGTSSGTYGSYANSITLSAASTYYFQFQLQENANDNNFGPEDRTITITNNSVSNTDLQVNVKIINR
jgi:hypothetical protein|tara:strand:- start:71 stop:1330 length:1260 start_codon:yes stop_codon:yes gene_type:complete